MTDFNSRRIMMVDTQIRPSDVTKFPIIDAMLKTPREAYTPAALVDLSYAGAHVPLGSDRVMMEPRTIAKMLDALNIQPDDLVLDLGCGLGYSTALMARMAEAVVAVEEDPAMADEAERTLGAQSVDNAAVITARLTNGSPKHGPFDVICVQGGVETMPAAITDQLKENGRIAAIFMSAQLGECRLGRKIDGAISWRMSFNATAPVLPGFEAAPSFVF